jgi:hypothetical protein
MAANALPLPPLLSLVSTRGESTLTIPPAPKLAIVPRTAPALDTAAVHRWVLKIRDLRAGDALVLPEYKVCCIATATWHRAYVVMGIDVILTIDARASERRAWRQVGEWLVRDGAKVCEAVQVTDEPTALRLSWVEE